MVRFWLGGLLLLLCGCVRFQAVSPPGDQLQRLHNAELVRDTVWSGQVLIDGSVKVFKGATLTILPGTEIRFVPRDIDRDGLGDGTLIVEGSLQAVGSSAQPIRFRSDAAEPKAGDWLEIRVDFSRDTLLRFCEIRDSAHTLHAHFTKAVVEDSHIHRNLDGCRLGQGNFVLRRNLIEDNEGKGINFRNATVEITGNIIRRNASGIFLFETDRPPLIRHNNLYANGDNLRLGDFFHTDLVIDENWWGSADPAVVAMSIYDYVEDASLGKVTAGIAPSWLGETGPRSVLTLQPVRSITTAGFLDAAPLAIEDQVLVAGWDGMVRRFDPDGRLVWETRIGEVIDALPATDQERIYGQSWGREVFALRAGDGAKLWSFTYPPSPADDHRQGGVILAGNLLLVPAWNGTLYALDPQTGEERWRFVTPGPLRASPSVDAEQIYLPGGDGVLYVLDMQGALRWTFRTPEPQLSALALSSAGPVLLDRVGHLFALTDKGQLRWQRDLAAPCYYAAPVVAQQAVYVATAGGDLWQLNLDNGNVIWRRGGLGPVYATPLLFDDLIVVGDNDGRLSAVNADSGDLLATVTAGGPIQGGPVRLGKWIGFGSRDQALHILAPIYSDPSRSPPQ